MSNNVLIPELAVVELGGCAADERPVAFGMVVSTEADDGTYEVEVVDPKSGQTDIVHAAAEDLRIKRII